MSHGHPDGGRCVTRENNENRLEQSLALEIRFAAPRDRPVERLVESLAALLPLRRRRMARRRITFLDTPDGRIARAGACLTATADAGGHRIEWRHGDVLARCTLGSALQFAWDIPDGRVRQRIDPVVGMRRLLPVAEIDPDGVLLDVMDATGKTVARVDIVAGRARAAKPRSPWRTFRPFLTLRALRGYDEACAGPIAIVESRPGLERSDCTLQGHVLQAIGADVPSDVSAYRVALEPGMSADAGWLRMQRELLRIVGANHAGVLSGLDSVFLRDFRAGVRRALALFGQMKGVLPQAEIDDLRAELDWLLQVTAPARDLDVLVCGLRAAPDGLDPGEPSTMLAYLEEERARTQQALAEHLTSERYRQLIDRWTEVLSRDPGHEPAAVDGALPLGPSVAQRAWRLYERVRAAVERVRGDTPAAELQGIRTEAAKLCDLLEAATGLFDPDAASALLQAVKPLETALGEYDAACRQESRLRRYAAMPLEATPERALVRGVFESLADRAARHAAGLRQLVNQQLLRFGEPANRRAFARVLHMEHTTELTS